MQKIKVLSLGGSLINSETIDVHFLKEFRSLIFAFARKKVKFLIVCGGGIVAREYQKSLRSFNPSKQDLDWIGVAATHLNARFIQLLFGKNCERAILTSLRTKIHIKKPICIGAGTAPGWSTDYNAFYFAKKIKVTEVINLTNVDQIYSIDSNANKVFHKQLSWTEYLAILSDQKSTHWEPGLSTPLDPVAARFARQNQMKCLVVNGKNLTNLKSILMGNLSFKGTLIK